uniref:Uncharacterized protein n=1 Tax=Aegilops tauschii TaxID=37682 RepID=N1QYG8_AEGTA
MASVQVSRLAKLELTFFHDAQKHPFNATGIAPELMMIFSLILVMAAFSTRKTCVLTTLAWTGGSAAWETPSGVWPPDKSGHRLVGVVLVVE